MISSPGVDIRPMVAGEEAALAALESPASATALEHWAWRHPLSTRRRQVMVAERDGHLLAAASAVDLSLRLAGEPVDAARVRTAVASGSSAGLASHVFDTLLDSLRSEGRLRLVLRCRAGGSRTPEADDGRWQPLVPSPRRLRRRVGSGGRSARSLMTRAELAPDWEPRLDELAAELAPWYRDAAVRSAEQALQRWAAHPSRRWHRFLLVPRFSSRPVGWLVLGVEGGICRWDDLLWRHDHPAALEAASRLATRLACQVGAELEEVWIGGDDETRQRLEALGFTDGPLGVSLEGLALNDDVPAIGSFYATAADLDDP